MRLQSILTIISPAAKRIDRIVNATMIHIYIALNWRHTWAQPAAVKISLRIKIKRVQLMI